MAVVPFPTPHRVNEAALCHTATVLSREGSHVRVELHGENVVAERALSCLIDPEPGDGVLVARTDTRQHFVLAVLSRTGGAGVTLSCPDDVTLASTSGKVRVTAEEGVTIAGGKNVTIASRSLVMRALEGTLAIDVLAQASQVIEMNVGRLRQVGQSVDTIFERAMARFGRSYRNVEHEEIVRAETLAHTAEKTLRLHGEQTLLTARTLTKIDAEQVQIG